MPTPVAHTLAGLAVHLAGRPPKFAPRWLLAAGLVALANLPDVDFLPGYLWGEPRAYHWGPTHSITAAVIAGLLVGLVVRRLGGPFLHGFVLASVAYGSHIFLDLLLGPGAPPSVGLQVFWPFSPERHMLPWHVFRMFPATIERIGPVRALFSADAVPLMAREIVILGPVCLAAWLLGRLPTAVVPVLARPKQPEGAGEL